jgi:cytochrome c biogenesis protein CcmG/thiol:disulfide interchange protein DsbE
VTLDDHPTTPGFPEPASPGPDENKKGSWLKKGGQGLTYLIVLGLLGLLVLGLVKSGKGPRESGMAPDFTLTGYNGQTVKLSELRGQVVIINFWASWCPPCREEAAYLEATRRKYQNKGVVFIGVDWVDTQKEALAYIKEFDITYFNGPDLGSLIGEAFRIKGVPETYYVAKNGELRGVNIGPLSSPQLDQKIDELLAEPYSGSNP